MLLLTGWAIQPPLGMAIVAAREGDTGRSAFEPDVVFRPGTLFTLAALHLWPHGRISAALPSSMQPWRALIESWCRRHAVLRPANRTRLLLLLLTRSGA